jgi:HSP20 family protein
MATADTKIPVTIEPRSGGPPSAMQPWRPFESLRREVDRVFEDFIMDPFRLPFRRPVFDIEPFWQPVSWITSPAIDLIERDDAFEMTADMPGLDEKDVEVKVANGVLTVKGQKQQEKEEKKKDFHLRERRFNSYERSIRVPETVEPEKIEASFKNGVLKVVLPKTLEARKSVKKVEVKGG